MAKRKSLYELEPHQIEGPTINERLAAMTERAERAERERDAYKRAKAENDDRFMRERDDARTALASSERERDDLAAQLDAMTNQAVMLSGRRATIVDVSAQAEVESLRAELAEVERERDGANLAVAHAQKFAEWAQKERDALRAELAAALRERDARPAISREDAAVYLSHTPWSTWSVRDPVHEALRALAARAASEPGRCGECDGGNLTDKCPACNGPGRKGVR